MIDLKLMRQNPELFKESMLRRGRDPELIDQILHLDEERRSLISKQNELSFQLNSQSEEMASLKREGKDISLRRSELRELSLKIKELEQTIRQTSERIQALLEKVPNVLHPSVPPGLSEGENRIVRSGGQIKEFSFHPLPHWELAKNLQLIDLERGSKISGSGFILYTGWGAKLERALINWMIDFHRERHGYFELWPPHLVNSFAAYGTGKLPDFEDQMYHTEGIDYYLNPTAEVPVTAIHANEVLEEEELPIHYVAYTACFRKEAGAAGKDTRGLLRVHQFNKVELVKFTKPEDSYQELEDMLKDAEEILQALELPYQVVELCGGEVGFVSSKTYDLNVWASGVEKYLEVSSCSNCTDFQARRLNTRFRREDSDRLEFVHTLNGSGVALPRTVAAIMENYQEADGSLSIPKVLQPYLGVDKITSRMGGRAV